MSGLAAARGPPGGAGGPCHKDFECEDGTYVKFEFTDCEFEEETDTGLIEITGWDSKVGEECEPISVEWEADGCVATKVMAFGGGDCDTVDNPDGSYDADREGDAGLDNNGGNTAAISNLQFCLAEADCVPYEVDGKLVKYNWTDDGFAPGDDGDGNIELTDVTKDGEGEPVQATFDVAYCAVDAVVRASTDYEVYEDVLGEVTVTDIEGHAISNVRFFDEAPDVLSVGNSA